MQRDVQEFYELFRFLTDLVHEYEKLVRESNANDKAEEISSPPCFTAHLIFRMPSTVLSWNAERKALKTIFSVIFARLLFELHEIYGNDISYVIKAKILCLE